IDREPRERHDALAVRLTRVGIATAAKSRVPASASPAARAVRPHRDERAFEVARAAGRAVGRAVAGRRATWGHRPTRSDGPRAQLVVRDDQGTAAVAENPVVAVRDLDVVLRDSD